jgi:class 3 adenylate cyclase
LDFGYGGSHGTGYRRFPRLRKLRRELFNPSRVLHRGRIVKITGDGTLIEFPSVVDAVTRNIPGHMFMGRGKRKTIPDDNRHALVAGIGDGQMTRAQPRPRDGGVRHLDDCKVRFDHPD